MSGRSKRTREEAAQDHARKMARKRLLRGDRGRSRDEVGAAAVMEIHYRPTPKGLVFRGKEQWARDRNLATRRPR